MKIIDFEKKGNVVRFYLGKDDLTDWWGDDWDDRPYECNAGTVYNEFISGVRDIAFPFDTLVLEPQEDWRNSGRYEYSKEDMKNRDVPCVIVVPPEIAKDTFESTFGAFVGSDRVIKFYFGDKMEDKQFAVY